MSVRANAIRCVDQEAEDGNHSADVEGLSVAQGAQIMSRIYERGDRLVTYVILLHALIALGLATFYQTWLVTGVVTVCAVAMFLLSVMLLPRSFITRCIAGVALQVFVVLHIYQTHGLGEMHFFFFTAFTVLIVYQDWKCMWPGAICLIAQHTGSALLHNAGAEAGTYFYEPGYVGFTRLSLHFAIALSQVGICGYWAYLLHEQTLASATQNRNLRRAEEAMRRAKEEAERANHAKSEFLSRVSHELRTPLNAILGFGQLLEIASLREQDAEALEFILTSGRHLLGLVDEVLDLSRAESGDLQLTPTQVDMAELAHGCLQLVAHLAHTHQVVCHSDELANPTTLWCDEKRLRQVLLNLLSNAIKYNREGGEVWLRGQTLEGGGFRWEVVDNGIGIAPKDLARLFVPFVRLQTGVGAREGVGLGLVVSRRVVEAMDGRLGLESVVGVGTTAWMEIPVGDEASGSEKFSLELDTDALRSLWEQTTSDEPLSSR